jgi:hypothetical protein
VADGEEAATVPVHGLASLSLNDDDSSSSSSSRSHRGRAESEGSTSGEEEEEGGDVPGPQRPQPPLQRPRPPPRPVRHATTTHRTVPLAQAIRPPASTTPPPLVDLALAAIADHCASLIDIQGLEEGLAVRLLGLILQRGKLDYRICRVFMASGHPALADAVAGLNLFDGLACQKPDGGGGVGFGFSPGGCR